MHRSNKTMSKVVNQGNLPKVWDLMVKLHRESPQAFENAELLKEYASQHWTSLKDKTRCPNCRASMLAYMFEFDMPNASMLIQMAEVVRHNLTKTESFNQANRVHVQSMPNATYAMKSRTTQMSKLGLIAKVLTDDKKHVSGTWLITTRGWNALAGYAVPKWVESFRAKGNRDGDDPRLSETTTIGDVMTNWKKTSRDKMLRGKKTSNDYTPIITTYDNHSDWVHFADVSNGFIL